MMGTSVEVSFHVPREDLEEIDRKVSEGKYLSRSEFIRFAIMQLLDRLKNGQAPPQPIVKREVKKRETTTQKPSPVVRSRKTDPRRQAARLLMDYIIYSLINGRFKANIKNGDSPVMLTLTQFRSFVWRRANTEDLLKMYVKKVSRKSTTTVMEDRPRRRDLLAEAWQRYTVKYLDELKAMGIVKEWWRKKTTIGYKYYVVVNKHE